MELFYHIWNSSKYPTGIGPKIALLHGMGGTGALWRPIAASLEDEISVLALDQRGHGKSRIQAVPAGREEPGYAPLDYGKDVVETIETLKFYPTWILGHSMGVRTAAAAAHLKPEYVNGLILVDLGFSGVAGGGLGENLAHFLRLLPSQFASREEAKLFMATHCPDPSIAQYLMAVSVRSPEGSVTFPFEHAALIQTIQAARDVSVRTWVKDLGSRGMPILVLRGEKSLVWTHEQFEQERIAFTGLDSIVFKEVMNAGHGLPFEQRPTFVSVVRKFIESHSK